MKEAVTAIAKGLGGVFGLVSNKKKAKAADAYANTKGQGDVDYSNAQTTYNVGLQNQTSVKDEKSRVARESLRRALYRSLGPNIMGQEAMPDMEAAGAYSPVDYSGAPTRKFTPVPDSNAGGFSGALSDLFNSIAAGSAASSQADDFQAEMDKYRFALQNPGVQQLPTSNVNYYDKFKKVFG